MDAGFGQDAPISARALGFAILAVFGVVLEVLFMEERLLGRRKNEISSTIYALQNAICEFRLCRSHSCHVLNYC